MKVSVIIPAYNEEGTITRTLNIYKAFMSENFEDFEIIAVNDGSTDNTLKEIKAFKGVDLISYAKNKGKGYAVKRGVLKATGDYIFFTDADCSYSPQNVLRAVSIFSESSVAGVLGVRENRKRDYPLIRRAMSKGLEAIIRNVLTLNISDTQCGFKGFEKSAAKKVFSLSSIFDFGFDFEVIYLMNSFKKPVAVMPIEFDHRLGSKVNLFKDTVKILKDIFYVKYKIPKTRKYED